MNRARFGLSSTLSFGLTISFGLGTLVGLVACEPADPGAECEPFVDEAIADEWQVDFVNMRAEPVYIEVDCRGQPFTLTDAQGQALIFAGFGCECFCDDLMDPGVDGCFECSADCLDFSWVQQIDPGATWSVTRPAQVIVENPTPIPAACVDQDIEAEQHCFAREAPLPGTYTLRSVSASTLTCSSGTCGCVDPNAEPGNCRTTGSLGERVDVETTLEFPGKATLVFEP